MIIDQDFYGNSKPYKLSELIKKVQAFFPDLYHSNSILKDVSIVSCSTIQEANKQDLVFIETREMPRLCSDSSSRLTSSPLSCNALSMTPRA